MTEPFRILALDGGGIRGIFSAAVVAEAQESFPDLVEKVDLICGTSTGGIIALGLADGKSGAEMLRFYRDEGAEVFKSRRTFGRLWGPKYDRTNLDQLLKREFGDDRVLNDLQKPVCVPAYELVTGAARVLKDDHAPGLAWGGTRKIWKVAAASSAAPTYFAPVQIDKEDSHVDGGVWANNPSLVGIVEAVRYFDRELPEIQLLSIGTAGEPFRIKSHSAAKGMGAPAWARKVLSLFQGSVSVGTQFQASLLLSIGNYLRIDDEQSEAVALDAVANSGPLEERGQQAARLSKREIAEFLGKSA